MPSFRLFIAIETPPDIKPQIAAIRYRLKASNADVKWEPDEKLHTTLRFLGNTREELLPQIVSYIGEVAQDTSSLLLKYIGVGCFPSRHDPKVIWVGMEDLKGNLSSLQKEIEAGMLSFGFEKDERTFHPHVTLGRVRSNKKLDSLLRTMESITFESQPVEIREVALIRSELNPVGSVYTILKRIPLSK